MVVTIGGVNITNKIKQNTFSIKRTEDMGRSMSFTIRTDQHGIYGGQEVIAMDGTSKVFGGLITGVNRRIVVGSLVDIDVQVGGYETILARRTVNAGYTNIYSGTVVTNIITNILAADGITAGSIENGIIIPLVNYVCKSVYDIVSDLATGCGFVWWIDDNKQLNFKASKTYTEAPYVLDDDIDVINRIPDADTPVCEEDVSDYANKVFVVGTLKGANNTDIVAIATNANELIRMQNLYGGTGVYGKVFTNDDLYTQEDADEAARKLLELHSAQKFKLTFTTKTLGFDVNQLLNVNYSLLGLVNMQFSIESIDISMYSDQSCKYAISCYNTIEINGAIKPSKSNKTWVDEIAQLSNTNNVSDSGNSGNGYVSALTQLDEYDNGWQAFFANEATPVSIEVVLNTSSQLQGFKIDDTYTVQYNKKTGAVPIPVV